MGKSKRKKGRKGQQTHSQEPQHDRIQRESKVRAAVSTVFAQRAIIWWLPILYLLISDSFYLRTYDSAQVKITLVQMGGVCLLALWLCRLLDEGKGVFSRYDLVTLAPFMAYFAYGIFSYLHAPYKSSSLDFFLRRIFYMTVPLIVIREFHSDAVDRLTRILILTTWITVGYGMLQWFDVSFFPPGIGNGPDPFIWRGAFGSRVFSTFGNPNFYADFLVLIFPVLVCQYLKNREWKLIPLIAMLLWTLYSTATKGAWVGFSFSVAFLTFTYLFFMDRETLRRWWKRVAVVIALLFIGVGTKVTLINNQSRWVSVNFRVFTWEGTWEMVMSQPLLGTGIGSYWVIYPAYRRPPIFHIEGKHNTETDHSENEWLEVFFDEGILGFGIFIWLILTACFVAYGALGQLTGGLKKGQRAPPRAYDIIGYLVALQGMLAHNFFDVSLRFVSSGVYLGLLSGLVVNLSRGVSLVELHPAQDGEEREPGAWTQISAFLIWPARLAAWGGLGYTSWVLLTQFGRLQGPLFGMKLGGEILQWWIAWGCFLLCVLSQAFIFARVSLLSRNALVSIVIVLMLWPLDLTWGFFRADVHHNIAIYFSKRKDWEQALKNYLIVGKLNRAFVMSFYFKGNVFNDRFNMAKIYNPNWGDHDGQPRDDFERALEAYNDVRENAPNYVQMHHQVGTLFLKRAEYEKQQGRPKEAEKYMDLALERFELYREHDPVFFPNYVRMAQIHMARKEYDKAAEVYRKYIEAPECQEDESLAQKPWMRKTLLAYQALYHDNGEWTHEHPKAEAYTQMANALFFKGDLPKAETAYKRALFIEPGYQNAMRNLQVLYDRARQAGALRAPPGGPAKPGPGKK